MPAKPLTPEQKEDAARLKEAFRAWQNAQRDAGAPVSQMEAAHQLGFGQSALSQYLTGKIPLNGPVLAKLAELLGITPEDISPSVAAHETARIDQWLAQSEASPDQQPARAPVVSNAAPDMHRTRNVRPVWVIGRTQGGFPERVWDDGGHPVGITDEYAEVSTTDEHAFVCRVVGDSMVPRYMPGEYALVEPGTAPELEDDVLVRLATGETMLKRLLSRRGGIRLGSYNTQEVMTFREEEITWMYYVAHPIPPRRIRQRIDSMRYHGIDRRHQQELVEIERRESARRLGGDDGHAPTKHRRSGT